MHIRLHHPTSSLFYSLSSLIFKNVLAFSHDFTLNELPQQLSRQSTLHKSEFKIALLKKVYGKYNDPDSQLMISKVIVNPFNFNLSNKFGEKGDPNKKQNFSLVKDESNIRPCRDAVLSKTKENERPKEETKRD